MPVPAVAVEIAAPEPERSSRLADVLLAACSDAAAQGDCSLVGPGGLDHDAPATARVIWGMNTRSARIEVWNSGREQGERRTRELEFATTDPIVERWRSTGFVTGTLANQLSLAPVAPSQNPEQAVTPAQAAAPPPQRQTPAGTPQRSNARADEPRAPAPADSTHDRPATAADPDPVAASVWLDLGPITGPGFATGAWRLGGFLRAAYAVRASFVHASFGYSVRQEDDTGLAARWLTTSVGGGYQLIRTPFGLGLDLRGDVVVENLQASIAPPAARADSGDQWAGGMRLGADVSWQSVPGLAVVLGGDLALFTGPVNIEVGGNQLATVPALRPSLLGGIRLMLGK